MRPVSLLRTVWRNRTGREERPRFLTYTVTFKCNLRCVMCDSWKLSGKGDLTIDEVDTVFAQLPRLDVVRLTGGEPFVRKDFGDIAALAQRRLRPLALQVTTNGFLTDKIVRFCEERPKDVPLFLLVSIDAVGAKHDEIRGVESSYANALETVRALADRRDELRLSLSVNQTVVDADGLDQYRELKGVLAPLSVDNQVVLAYDVSATYSVERDRQLEQEADSYETFGNLETKDVAVLLDEIEHDVQRYPWKERLAKTYYLDGLRSRILGEGRGPNPPCVALHGHMRLFPNGDVPTCQFSSKVVGNLRESSFEEVWTSAAADAQRDWVRKCPGCWAECEVLPSAAYSGDLVIHPVRRALQGRKATTAGR